MIIAERAISSIALSVIYRVVTAGLASTGKRIKNAWKAHESTNVGDNYHASILSICYVCSA